MTTSAELHPDLPMTIDNRPRRLNRHERIVLRRLIYAMAGREQWRVADLLAEAITICDDKIAPVKNNRRKKR